MKRKAIIIASPLRKGQSGFLPGVQYDAMNYATFLRSPLGGAWRSNEIEILVNPSKSQVIETMFYTTGDYVFTAFSGHGGTDSKTKRSVLNINERESIWLSQLTAKASRQLAIVDTCSTYLNYGFPKEPQLIGDPFSPTSKLTLSQARYLFDHRVMASRRGWTVLHSSSPGEASIDTEKGGVFSLSILKTAKIWENMEGNGRFLPVSIAYSSSFMYLKKKLKANQTPRILHSGVNPNFPFAVK